jgi:hypothetical protein
VPRSAGRHPGVLAHHQHPPHAGCRVAAVTVSSNSASTRATCSSAARRRAAGTWPGRDA